VADAMIRAITIIGFDAQAQSILRRLRTQGIRIGTQDLRIAAIVLSQDATLVTRNVRDFATIPTLDMKDWSLPEEEEKANA
jgi:tRNA(fMet)-specific endonuclease VapC